MTRSANFERNEVFKKIITVKTRHQAKLQKLKQSISKLEKLKISMTSISKISKKSVRQIQKQRHQITMDIAVLSLQVKILSKELDHLEAKYMELLEREE